MSSFWNIWVWVLTLGSLVGCFLLLRMCLKNFAGVEEGESMGHTFDGIEELNNPLPKWWSTFFLLTIVWAFGYIALYGLGNWTGVLGWKSSNQGILNLAESKAKTIENLHKDSGVLVQYDREVAAADAKFGPIFEAYAARSIEDLATDGDALKVGQRLFIQNCSQCHGSDAHGTTGFPNLTDKDWLYGGTPAVIKETIMNGRIASGMMAWEGALGGDQGVKEVAAYVISLSGRSVDPELAKAGKAKFALCAACHGPDGQGSLALGMPMGAPNLTDNVWLYGGSKRAIEESIRNGRAGVMPPWKDILGEEKVHLISAYVYSLSQD
ncbi:MULTISPECIES: cytochrome-c oxidase, cbb3-type subunit III [Colwellia]|uniref:Cbb3-type cytochrome c oxidase subunit n=1 Tax=Colwellia psychrerythraea (strain 34H / ATCC BAA-681) TaxID=167879 RepID=Q483P4_COLP3|nr:MULTISPECIES: cytochrome-c oxidase, cbb3-type subunit III [Colwellia]AAZ26947.1 cytochrome c oxidase, cbb3-type, subunit III [Colwellia psychrerythraea 34H]PKH88027.1 cytochrome-c oxidase, cbb3-type subunit III [Colwellia sp. Bg11-28]